jgi:hypothetical protein
VNHAVHNIRGILQILFKLGFARYMSFKVLTSIKLMTNAAGARRSPQATWSDRAPPAAAAAPGPSRCPGQ